MGLGARRCVRVHVYPKDQGYRKLSGQWRDASGKQHAQNFDKHGDAFTFNSDKLAQVSRQRRAMRGRGVVESPEASLGRLSALGSTIAIVRVKTWSRSFPPSGK